MAHHFPAFYWNLIIFWEGPFHNRFSEKNCTPSHGELFCSKWCWLAFRARRAALLDLYYRLVALFRILSGYSPEDGRQGWGSYFWKGTWFLLGKWLRNYCYFGYSYHYAHYGYLTQEEPVFPKIANYWPSLCRAARLGLRLNLANWLFWPKFSQYRPKLAIYFGLNWEKWLFSAANTTVGCLLGNSQMWFPQNFWKLPYPKPEGTTRQ